MKLKNIESLEELLKANIINIDKTCWMINGDWKYGDQMLKMATKTGMLIAFRPAYSKCIISYAIWFTHNPLWTEFFFSSFFGT